VSVDAHVKAGEIDSLGRHDDGRNARVTTAHSAAFTIDAKVGAGHLEIVRAS
jgi:hypothetical protein